MEPCYNHEPVLWGLRLLKPPPCYELTSEYAIPAAIEVLYEEDVALIERFTNLTRRGTWWCGAMALTMLGMAAFHFYSLYRMRRGNRLFPTMVILVHVITASMYGLMYVGDGFEPVPGKSRDSFFDGVMFSRQFANIRYIEWVLTTPTILSLLMTAAAAPPSYILSMAVNSIASICGLLVAAIDETGARWLIFNLMLINRLIILFLLIWTGYVYSGKLEHPLFRNTFLLCAGLWGVSWSLTPLVWALCEGYHSVSVDDEIIMYSVLDVISKPIVCSILLGRLQDINPVIFGLTVYAYDGWSYKKVIQGVMKTKIQGQLPTEAGVGAEGLKAGVRVTRNSSRKVCFVQDTKPEATQ